MLVGQTAEVSYSKAGMLVSQTAGVGRKVCWLVKQLG